MASWGPCTTGWLAAGVAGRTEPTGVGVCVGTPQTHKANKPLAATNHPSARVALRQYGSTHVYTRTPRYDTATWKRPPGVERGVVPVTLMSMVRPWCGGSGAMLTSSGCSMGAPAGPPPHASHRMPPSCRPRLAPPPPVLTWLLLLLPPPLLPWCACAAVVPAPRPGRSGSCRAATAVRVATAVRGATAVPGTAPLSAAPRSAARCAMAAACPSAAAGDWDCAAAAVCRATNFSPVAAGQ